MAEQKAVSSRAQVITIFGGEDERSLELTVTRELLELLDLTAVINRGTSERFDYSFSGLILAFRYGTHGISKWFQQYLAQKSVDFAAILKDRGILEDQLRGQIASYQLPFEDLYSVYPNGQRFATASALSWIVSAKRFAEQQKHEWTGLRHMMGAVIFAPGFHAEDLKLWRLDRRELASSYLDYVQRDLPQDLHFWQQVNTRTFGPASSELSQADIDRFSGEVQTILARANQARENEKKDRIYTEHLVFSLRQPGSRLTRLAEASGIDLDIVLKRDYGISNDQPLEFHSLPPMSQNAYGALLAARDKAKADGSNIIEDTHLLFGVLSQTTSAIVQELNKRGITPDKVIVGTEAGNNAVQTSTSESTLARLDLGKFQFSIGATAILHGAAAHAAEDDAPVSTSIVLKEIATQGRPGRDRQWVADFLLDAVSAGKFQETMATYRGGPSGLQRSSARQQKSGRQEASLMKPGLAWSLTRAQEIATETTGEAAISGRHLLAALIVDVPQPHTLGAQRLLVETGIDVPLLRQRMYEWVRGYGDNDLQWRAVLIGTGTEPRRKVDFDADSTTGLDFIGIEQDVLALATLIAARDSSPPLSIGLFGDWGSGKTFFMGKLRSAIAQFSREAREANTMQRDLPFYKRIVQIDFNAWHYVEGNLWASMVEHILENLRVSDDQRLTVTETLQQHWIAKLGFTEQAKADADKKKTEASAKVSRAEADVRTAANAHEAKKTELQTLSRKNAARAFRLSGAFQVITDALEPLGLKPVTDAVTDLQSSLRQARSAVEGGSAAFSPLIHAEDRQIRWLWLLIILVGAPLVAGLIGWFLILLGHERIAQISEFAAGAAGLLTGCATWLRKQAKWVSEQTKKIEEAQRNYDQALAKELADTADQITKTEQELALARQDYMLAQQRAEQARREREAALSDLAAATTARLLGQFIQDRAASTDYRKHLGVLAVVRQDFQELSKLIEEDNWRLAPEGSDDQRFAGRLKKIDSLAEEAADAATRINRIVLYIDDLDRCPPAKVVEVLQAVHLLLAFPLFVVVVGVDARWISRSLESRYRELLHFGQADAAVDITEMFGVARSEDYLEKIFQIPLWLRRMDADTAQRMVQGLLGKRVPLSAKSENKDKSKETAGDAKNAGPPAGQNVVPLNQKADVVQEATIPAPAAPADAKAAQSAGTSATPTRASTPASPASVKAIVPNLQSLEIRDFELFAIEGLASLLGRSPRALKRFVNLYRLIKAGLTPAEHNAFVRHSEEDLGGYHAVLFLLAVDTGLPRVSRAVFDTLLAMKERRELGIKQFFDNVGKHTSVDSADWGTLKDWIDHLEGPEKFERGMAMIADWIPRVARYSFQASHFERTRELPDRVPKNHRR